MEEKTSGKFLHKGGKFILGIIGGTLLAIVLALVFGYFIQLLWNWLMPDIFNLGKISYWQGFGLIILARILFGTFGMHGGRHFRKFHGHPAGKFCGLHPDYEDWGTPEEWKIKGGWKNWKYYKDYWREEGKSAFEKFVENKQTDQVDKKTL